MKKNRQHLIFDTALYGPENNGN